MSKKAWVLVPLAAAGWAAVMACGAGSNGVSGTSSIVNTTPEPAGPNCAGGGTRIDVGLDSNGDGKLDASEIKQTQYVCNGGGGAGAGSFLIATSPEAAGANCVAGGTKIESGPDSNHNGTLDANEVTSTEYVCNGSSAVGSGANAVGVYDGGAVLDNTGVLATLIQATITVPGSGSIVAVASVDVFCASPAVSQGYDCAGSPPTDGFVGLTTDNFIDPADAASLDQADTEYFYLNPNTTTPMTRTRVISAPSAGTYTVYMNGEAQDGQMGFFRPQITLVYLPH